MGARRVRFDLRMADQKVSRRVNGAEKAKERIRRDRRIVGLIRKAKFPYLPSIMSWLSAKLGKPSTQITEADVKKAVG